MPRLSINPEEVHPTTLRHYRPPDPEWADTALLEKVRQTLIREDPRLNLWWNPNWKSDDPEHPGRWSIVYWLNRTGCWSVVFYHEGAAGEFRPIDPSSVAVLLHRLRACQEDARTVQDRIDRERDERVNRQHRELVEALNENFEDVRARAFGSRGIYAPGYIRKRDDRAPGTRPRTTAQEIQRELRRKHALENEAVAAAARAREMRAH